MAEQKTNKGECLQTVAEDGRLRKIELIDVDEQYPRHMLYHKTQIAAL